MMKTKNIVLLIIIILSCLSAVAQIGANSGIDMFSDKRDNKTYRTVKIGKLMWMAENLNFQADSSWCYNNADSNCAKYGRLYTWDAAMKACPEGWHLPNNAHWSSLFEDVGGKKAAGRKLKSKIGWNYGSGTDDFVFSALPGGDRYINGEFLCVGNFGHWWSATENGSSGACALGIDNSNEYVHEYHSDKGGGLSVRCVRDASK